MFTPEMWMSAVVAVPVVAAILFGISRHNHIAPPQAFAPAAVGEGALVGELAPVLAEAKRDIG
jgi:hypothetical protein